MRLRDLPPSGGHVGPERNGWGLFAVTSLPVLAVYLLTLAPGVTGGDAGELIASAYTGGSPHPPGYPLFAILGRIVGQVPVGTVAWRFNVFTAVCGAGAAGLLAVGTALEFCPPTVKRTGAGPGPPGGVSNTACQ